MRRRSWQAVAEWVLGGSLACALALAVVAVGVAGGMQMARVAPANQSGTSALL